MSFEEPCLQAGLWDSETMTEPPLGFPDCHHGDVCRQAEGNRNVDAFLQGAGSAAGAALVLGRTTAIQQIVSLSHLPDALLAAAFHLDSAGTSPPRTFGIASPLPFGGSSSPDLSPSWSGP